MSTDYQLLLQKFYNFKKFIAENAKIEKCIEEYNKMSDNEFLLFGIGFLLPNKDRIDLIVPKICEKVGLTEPDQKDKVKRYIECFIEYLDQLNTPEMQQQVILGNLQEKNIEKV